jgi:CDP-6-deoxy-D-xylo-4-hexulose-3-dehydrase
MPEARWPLMKNAITQEDRNALVDFINNSDRYTNGPIVRNFEKLWAEWVGSKYALMVSSGSTANFLIVAAIKELYNLQNGDKVLLPACTWVTTVSPFIQLGFTPIFADINLEDYSYDREHLEQISRIHPDIKMISVTHLLGYPAPRNFDDLWPNALVIDDVCESHGCEESDGVRVGSKSLAASYSFYFGHHMTTIEGGVISTNNEDLYDLMRMKRSHGLARESENFDYWAKQHPYIDRQFLFITDGYNFRSTDFNAVLGITQLKRLDFNIAIRRANYAEFFKIINSRNDLFYPVAEAPFNSSFAFPFICRDRNTMLRLKQIFVKNGIEYRPVVGGNLLKQPFLKNYTFGAPRANSTADLVNDNGVYIGNSHFVNLEDMKWLEGIVGSL